MILVLTSGTYDEYGIEQIVEIADAEAQPLVERLDNLKAEYYGVQSSIKGFCRQQDEYNRRLLTMKKHHKIRETEGALKKNEVQIVELRQRSRNLCQEIGKVSQRIREIGMPVKDSVARELYLDV